MINVRKIITGLYEKRKESGVEPVMVQLQDFLKAVTQEAKEELWELVKGKEVMYHQTLNGHAFSIPGEKNNNDEDRQGRT
ncbi:MAG: hypothetical protein ACI4T5_02655 [Prevotella sp.]